MIVAVDLDGTIGQYAQGQRECLSPLPGAVETVNRWYDVGHTIVIDTARDETWREYTKQWLQQHGFKYHSLHMGKPDAQIVIDDRPRRFIQVETNVGVAAIADEELL